jgi:hypothetical protein
MTAGLLYSADGLNVGQRIGQLIVALLAVAGAGLIGYLLTAFTLGIVCRWFVRRRLPQSLNKVLSVAGGVLAAIVVFWLAFWGIGGGFGWGGLGFGGAEGTSGNGTEPDRNPALKGIDNTLKESPPASVPASDAGQPASALSILLLGGDRVRGQTEDDLTFYQVLPEGVAMGFRELKILLRQRQAELPPLREIEIEIRPDSVAQNHPAVRRLENWAREMGLSVRYRVVP